MDLTSEEILTEVQAFHMQVWSVNDLQAVAVTMIKNDPSRHLFVYVVAGDGVHEWFPALMETIEAAAKKAGCTYSECVARPGWARVSRPIGYQEVFRVLRKEI